jgi:capsular polysaccharide transport system permease protein
MTLETGYAGNDVEKFSGVSSDEYGEHSGERGALRLLWLFFTKRNSLICFVFVPSLLAAIYYFGIASGQYVSETRMIVRTIGVSEKFDTSEQRGERSIIGGDSLTQDSYIVANYLRSPEIVKKLSDEIKLRELFNREGIDALSKLAKSASIEDLYNYWNRQIDTYVDGPSGVIVFTVRAFSPEDSVSIAKAALNAAEAMVDRISEKAKRDLVGRGEIDVTKSLEEYQAALNKLQQYQNETGILDPASSARVVSTVIGKLIEQKTELVIGLEALKTASADDSARARQMRRSIKALEDQIQLRKDSLAGVTNSDGNQLSGTLNEFAQLETRRLVTKALYEATVRNLDTAKSTALKRTTFISIFSNSNLPERARYPDRLAAWAILTLGLFILWITATLIWMSIEDHRV